MFAVHILSLVFSLGLIVFADKQAFAWIRGKKLTLNAVLMRRVHLLMWAGLLLLAGSGLLLFLPMASYLLSQPLFIVKMFFVAILFVNAVLIGRLMEVATLRPFGSLSWVETLPLFVSGAVSTFSWACAIIIAFYFF
jgi:hypothetical protein